MILGLVGIYLALAALFYLRLTRTATDVAVATHRARWQRARTANSRAFRRIRPLPALRVPKRTR